MKKNVLYSVALILLCILFIRAFIIKPEKEKIFDYVIQNEELILQCIDEINDLSSAVPLNYGESIVNVEKSSIRIKGLFGHRDVELTRKAVAKIVTEDPVKFIGIEQEIIIFDCGGKGIAPSSQNYAFYYSPAGAPYAVFDGVVVCNTTQMKSKGNGFEYIDDRGNIFYTERIKDNFYFCKASF
ncbi:MAG: hypothetical protein IJO50_01625 [Clostridia bacterium]|nr:hypothetical protein [Clostridia bacterium]